MRRNVELNPVRLFAGRDEFEPIDYRFNISQSNAIIQLVFRRNNVSPVGIITLKQFACPFEMTDFNAEVILPDLQSSHFSRLERQQRRRKRNCNVLAQS